MYTRESQFHCVLITWEHWHYGVFGTNKRFLKTNFGRLPDVFIAKELRLPSGEYTGESITKTNNSTNIRQNSKSFLGPGEGYEESRDTALLTLCKGLIQKIFREG